MTSEKLKQKVGKKGATLEIQQDKLKNGDGTCERGSGSRERECRDLWWLAPEKGAEKDTASVLPSKDLSANVPVVSKGGDISLAAAATKFWDNLLPVGKAGGRKKYHRMYLGEALPPVPTKLANRHANL